MTNPNADLLKEFSLADLKPIRLNLDHMLPWGHCHQCDQPKPIHDASEAVDRKGEAAQGSPLA